MTAAVEIPQSDKTLLYHELCPRNRRDSNQPDEDPGSNHSGNDLSEDSVSDESPSEGPNGTPFLCNICGKTFSVLARLQRHIRIHTGEKPFECDFCEKSFSVKENLIVHRRIHTKERPYQCNICERAFEHSGKLHRHMRTHTGERPHRCELCGKTFVQSGQLVIHMRAHTGEKPYTCQYCQKGFTCSKQLKVHTRTHTGEKPYECDVCGKTFGYNHVLKMHKMSHLGEKLYKCTLCDKFFNSRKALDRHIKEHDEDPFTSMKECKKMRKPKTNTKEVISPQDNNDTPTVIPPLCPIPQTHQFPSHIPEKLENENQSFPENLSTMHNQPTVDPIHRKYFADCPPGTLSPPRSPEYIQRLQNIHHAHQTNYKHPILVNNSDHKLYEDHWFYKNGGFQTVPHFMPEPLSHQLDMSQLTFFTTIDGERIACPSSQVIRIPGPTFNFENDSRFLPKEFQDTLKIREELNSRLHSEETRKERERQFFDRVIKVLESCIGNKRLEKLGYPKYSIDEVIMHTLKLMGTQPCWEPSLDPMDRIKVNLRLLLECCIPDPELWEKFGWKGKSIEDIVADFLNSSA